jgi:rhodanese-related sulfurtransferase
MTEYLEFATRHPYLVLAAVLLLALAVGHEVKLLTRRYREVGPAELVRLVNGGALLLDLRDAAKYQAGHIAGALHVAPDELADQIKKLVGPKPRAVIAYCDVGQAAGRAAAWLAANGYPDAAVLKGGLAAWQADNLPLARG